MKNASLILNIVLLVAVGVLYFLHFSGPAKSTSTNGVAGSMASELKIAYVNGDTLSRYYAFLEANKTILEAKQKKVETEYRNRAMGLQNEIASYQRNVNSMTLSQVRATEEDLGKKQQNLQMYQQSLSQQLMEEEAKVSKELYDRVTSYLKKYGTEKGLQIVFKYDVSSDVLYGGEALDITKDVLVGLNDEYKNEKNGGAKADSTAVKK